MKKLLTFTVAALFAVTTCAFTACTDKNNDNVGVIKGNYKEVEAEQLQTVIETIENNTESGLSGLEFAADLSLSCGIADVMSETYDASFGYKLAMSVSDEAFDITGSGEGKLNYKSETNLPGGKTTVESAYEFKAYNDSDYIYLDLTEGTDTKLKIDLDEVFGNVEDYLPGDNDEEDEMSVAEMLNTLSEAGVKTYLDETDGIKIKLSVTEDCVDKIIENVIDSMDGVVSEQIADMITSFTSSLEFSAFKFDIYFAFDDEGAFLQFAADMDIALTADASSLGVGEISLSVKGGFSVKAYNGTVTIPDGIAEDESYTEYLPDMM